MTDQLLSLLRIVLLIALYVFFARVLWAVWVEVRVPALPRTGPGRPTSGPQALGAVAATFRVSSMRVIAPVTHKGHVIAVSTTPWTIGRASDNDLCIPDDPYMSGRHARIFLQSGYAVVEDLGSTNGTYVNNTRISEPNDLEIGDRVQMGGVILEAVK
jgi:pSer/pThr/pTyr-binding forkhead associated (FHA) protein